MNIRTGLLCIGLLASSCSSEADKQAQQAQAATQAAQEAAQRTADSLATAQKAQAETEIRIISEKLQKLPKKVETVEEYCQAKTLIAELPKYATIPLSQQFADSVSKESTKKQEKALERVLLSIFNIETISLQAIETELQRDYAYPIKEIRWDKDDITTKGESASIQRSCVIVVIDKGFFKDTYYKLKGKYILKYKVNCNESSYFGVQEEKAEIEPVGNVPMKRIKRKPAAFN